MLKKILLKALLLMLVVHANAKIISLDYDWEQDPECTVLKDESDLKENVICLKLFERYEYFYDGLGNLMVYNTFHKIVKINNDEEINSFNKIYISLYGVLEINEVKARSVNPDGTVVNFNKGNIKEIKDEEGSEGYKIFAIEGIQKGADVEFFYIKKMYGDYNGRSYFQHEYPIKIGSFELYSPQNLQFDFKVYNDTSRVEKVEPRSESEEKRNFYKIDFENVEDLNVPLYAYYNPQRIRVEFRLDKNTNIGQSQMNTWNDAANRVYEMVYSLDQGEIKSLSKFLRKELKLETNLTDKEKIIEIENYLKKNFLVREYGPREFTGISFIIKNKITTPLGMVRLFANVFSLFGIDHQIVLTSDRSKIKFDGSFQSWNYLDEYLIYFPGIDQYLSPSSMELKLGFVPILLTATDGLFVEKVQILNYESAVGKIKYIEPLSYEKNFNNMLIEIDIDTENEKAVIKTEMSLNGMSGGYFKELYNVIEENRKEEFLKSIMDDLVGANELLKIELRDKSMMKANDTIEGPCFIIYAEYASASILERAGSKYILNIGETIGSQVQMYRKDERIFDVENDYNRWYYREIFFNLPDGYTIKNPDAVNMYIVHEREGEKVYGFESNYNQNGQQYKVIIDEYYKKIYTDKSLIDEFKNVINAAADFNKVSLVLEKK